MTCDEISEAVRVGADDIIRGMAIQQRNDEALIKELVAGLKAAQELALIARSMTKRRSDDDYVSGIQDEIDAALSKAEAR